MPDPVENISLQVVARPIRGTGLQETLRILQAIKLSITDVNSSLANIGRGAVLKPAAIEQTIKQVQKKIGGLKPLDLAKALEVDPATLDKALANFRARLTSAAKRGGLSLSDFFKGDEFKSAARARQFFDKEIFAAQRRASAHVGARLSGSLTPTPSQVAAVAAQLPLQNVKLEVRGDQVVATLLPPPIQLQIPGSMVQASVAGPIGQGASGRDPKTGRFTGGEDGGKGRKSQRGSGKLTGAGSVPELEAEIARRVIQTEKFARTTVTQATAIGETLATTYDELNNVIKKTATSRAGATLLKTLRERRALEMESFRAGKAGLARGDFFGLAALQMKSAEQLEAILTDEIRAALGKKHLGAIEQKIGAQANTLRAQARANFQKHAALSQAFEQQIARETVSIAQFERDVLAEYERRLRQQERFEGHRTRLHRQQRKALEGAMPPLIPPPHAGGGAGRGGAFEGFTPGGFGERLAKVTAWTGAVTVLYGSVELVNRSLQTMAETGLQTARLSQVFRGVGGNAQQLTDDILALAAAEGRSREEAMESAIQWARLGLTRAQVNEAVRQSLIAANVAELDALEATEKLQAVMQAYRLEVGELASVLGGMNAISNTFNVTNKDLLEGLSRTANVAKQAQLPLFELMGIIGATVGATGQTGANIGNAVKSLIVTLSNPEFQKVLRQEFGFEVTKNRGREIQDMSSILHGLAKRFEELSDKERQTLLAKGPGKTQASRVVAVFEQYHKAQLLTISALLNLDSAEKENAKIKATLISRMRALGAETARTLVMFDDKTGLTKQLADAAGGMRVLMQVAGQAGPVLAKVLKALPITGALFSGPVIGGGILGGLFRLAQRLGFDAPRKATRLMAGFDEEREKTKGIIEASNVAERLIRDMNAKGAGSPQYAKTLKELETLGMGTSVEAVRQKRDAAREALLNLGQEKRTEIEKMIREQPATIEGDKVRVQLNHLLDEMDGKIKRVADGYYEVEDAAEGQRAMSLETLAALEAQKAVIEAIGEVYRELPAFSKSDRLTRDLESLRAQEHLLATVLHRAKETEATRKLGFKDFRGQTLTPEQRAKTEAELERVRAELLAKSSMAHRGMVGLADRVNMARQLAGAEGAAGAFGDTELQRLMNQKKALEDLIKQKQKLLQMEEGTARAADAFVAIEQHKADLLQVQLDLQKEKFNLAKQEYEFGRKLLTAGPRELLQRIVADRLARRGINTGQFFALSPEVRGFTLEAIARQQYTAANEKFGKNSTAVDFLMAEQNRLAASSANFPAVEAGAAAMELAGLREQAGGAALALQLTTEGLELTGKALQSFRAELMMTAHPNQVPGAAAPRLAQAHGP